MTKIDHPRHELTTPRLLHYHILQKQASSNSINIPESCKHIQNPLALLRQQRTSKPFLLKNLVHTFHKDNHY